MTTMFKAMLVTLTCCILLSSGCTTYYNYSGANQKKAEQEAHEFAESMGLKVTGITCNKHDTDGDGYTSCTFGIEGAAPQTYECAVESLVFPNEGCREPKIRMPQIQGK